LVADRIAVKEIAMFAIGKARRRQTRTLKSPRPLVRAERLEERRLLATNFIQQDYVLGHRVNDTGIESSADVGTSVAVDGDLMVVGSPWQDVNGVSAGAAFVYRRDDRGTPGNEADDAWRQEARLTASETVGGLFGYSVAISGDTIVVGDFRDSRDTDGDGSIDLFDTGAAYVFGWDGESGVWTEQAKLTASDPAFGDHFGVSVAISRQTIVVGSHNSDLDTDGDGAVDIFNAGAAYVFQFDGASWTEQAKLTAADAGLSSRLGEAVAISGDAIVAGSPGDLGHAGSAYVFAFDGEAWTEQAKLIASDGDSFDRFGSAVAVSGETAVVGSYQDDLDIDGDGVNDLTNAGSVYVFRADGADWRQQAKLTASNAGALHQFGFSVAISGNTIVAGDHLRDTRTDGLGSAHIFRFDDESGGWLGQARLTADDAAAFDGFGRSVAASGQTVIVGSPFDDVDTDGDGADDRFGAGSAYAFRFDGEAWRKQDKVVGIRTESGPEARARLGHSVAIDGDLMVAGAPRENATAIWRAGAAYLYRRDDNGTPSDENDDFWRQEARLTASDISSGSQFGVSVAVSGQTVVVGSLAGSAYVFHLDGAAWSEEARLTAAADGFGVSVAISDRTIVVGSPEDEVDRDGDGEFDVFNAGSAYVFGFDGAAWRQTDKLTAADAAPRDRFGASVAISGGTIVVGSPEGDVDADGDGAAHLFNAGSAYIFGPDGGAWRQQAKLTASDADRGDSFGFSVAVSGQTVIVGSPFDDLDTDGDGVEDLFNAGSAYVFGFAGAAWAEKTKLIPSAPIAFTEFGWSVAISGQTAAVGNPDAQSAYVFDFDGASWNEEAMLTAGDESPFSGFGASVAIAGRTVVVGSPEYDVDTDGDGTIDLFNAGSAYVFIPDPPPIVQRIELGDDLRSFEIQFNDDDLDGARAEDLRNYGVTAAGADAVFGTADDMELLLESAVYDPEADTIILRTVDPFFDDIFRLEIDGDDATTDGAPGLTDLAGNHLEGGDYTQDFDLTALTLVGDLLTHVEELNLSTGAENSLTAKLDAVLEQLEINVGNDQSLTAKLEAFIRGVEHWYDKNAITLEEKDLLIAEAELILLGLALTSA
jgi:hypothetical protein